MSKLEPELIFRDFFQILGNENDLVEITKKCDPNFKVGAIIGKEYEGKLPYYSGI